jgi:hypothetical protein
MASKWVKEVTEFNRQQVADASLAATVSFWCLNRSRCSVYDSLELFFFKVFRAGAFGSLLSASRITKSFPVT